MIKAGITLVLGLAISLVVMTNQAQALSGSSFQAGRIIDNAVFYNSSAMTAQQIQAFLNSKVSSCDSGGNLPYYGTYKKVTYNGNILRKNLDPSFPPPYTCLKDYLENRTTHANNSTTPGSVPAGCTTTDPTSGLNTCSAAQIIYDSGVQYSINPQVLLVLLQKESGIVTDDWPWTIAYRSAAGQGCPDTSACDTSYYGLYNQVHGAARQFRLYANNPTAYNYVVGTNQILYNPTASCGRQTVLVQNQATASLYDYTPYVPNNAALNNLYGSGDDCSSYGNRNFWRYFNDWFGSTYSQQYFGGYNWKFENLDGGSDAISTSSANSGQTPTSITLGGVLHIFYYSAGTGGLQHAYSDSTGWHFEGLDGGTTASGGRIAGNVGVQPTAIVYNNAIHLFYYDASDGFLRHAWSDSNGRNWQYETIDGNGVMAGSKHANVGLNPTVTTYGNGLQLFYYDQTNSNLRHAWTSSVGGSWNFENLDGDPGSIGHRDGVVGQSPKVTSLGGNIQLVYYDQTHGVLRHAWTNASGWNFENLDGDPGSIGHFSANVGQWSAITTSGTNLQLVYYDGTNGNLRHAWTNTNGWNFENLDGDTGSLGKYNANVGLMPQITANNGTLYTFYYDQTNGLLRSAIADGTGWHFANVDGNNGSLAVHSANTGFDPTSVVYNGTIQVYYYDGTAGALRHAFGIPQ